MKMSELVSKTIEDAEVALAIKNKEVLQMAVSAKDFGAKGDGVTDDTEAIQSVIDSLENGGVIFFPEGIYLVSSSLVIDKSNVTLKGLDQKLVEIKDHPSMTTPVPILLITGVDKTNRIENVSIVGIKIRNGSATTGNYTSGKDGIRTIFVNNFTIKHCIITEIQGGAGLTFRYCRNINILENYIYRCTYAACDLLEECEDIRILDNEIDTLTSTYTSNTYAIATGYDFEYGIADFPVRNLWIERNIIRNNPRWEGIDSHGGQNIWIRGNYVENCKTGLMVSVVEPEYFVDIRTKNVFIENNIFKRGNGEQDFHGLYVGGSNKALIENVVIKGNEVVGFGDESSGALVVLHAVNVEVSQNMVDEYYYNGITVKGSANDVRVHDNLIKNKDVSIITQTNAIFVNQSGNIGISIKNNKSYPDSDAQSPTYVVNANSSSDNNVTAKGNSFKGTSTLYGGKVLAGFEPGDHKLDNLGLYYLKKGDIVYDKNENPLYLITGPETGHAGNRPLTTYLFSGTVGTKILTMDTWVGGATGDYGLGCNITIPLSGGGTFKAIVKSWTTNSLVLDRNLPENIVSKSVTNDVATWQILEANAAQEIATNVKSEGAKGDGTNDTANIQAVLNSSKYILFPYGSSFNVTGTLYVPDNTVIFGYGAKIYNATNHTTLLSLGNGVKIFGLEMQGFGNSAYNGSGYAISIVGANATNPKKSILIENCHIHHFGGYGIYSAFASDIQINNVKIHDVGYVGFMGLSVSNVRINKSHIKGVSPGNGGNAYGITFRRADSTDVTTYPISKDCVVSECLIEDITVWRALENVSGENIKFTHNTIRNCKLGIAVLSTNSIVSIGCSIIGNTLYGTTGTGYGIYLSGVSSSVLSSRCIISENILFKYGEESNNNSGAIYVSNTLGLIISSNVLRDCFIGGIQLYSYNLGVVVTGNSIIDVQSAPFSAPGGIVLNAGNNSGTISGNTLLRINAALNTFVCDRGIYCNSLSGTSMLIGPNHNTFLTPVDGGNSTGVYYGLYDSNVKVFVGTAPPEGVTTAGVGSLYINKFGSTSTTLYLKETGSGNTGWKAK